MTAKAKKTPHPFDEHTKNVIDNAEYYNVAFFQPGTSTRVYQTFDDLDVAKKYAEVSLSEPNRLRSAMIYAIDEYRNHALVGTMGRDLIWKKIEN
jgi:hypothetical protein